MSVKTYYTIGITGTVIAFILDCLLGGPLFSTPIAYIYMGFALTLSVLYHVVKPHKQHQ